MATESQENSSNEESSTEGNKLLKSMKSVLSSLQKSIVKALNTQEEERKGFAEFEKNLYSRQSEMMDLERHINDDRHRETMDEFSLVKNQMANAERDQPRITQSESSRRNNSVSTGTISRRAPSNDDNPRPNKRGGGRSGGDRGGRNSGGGHSRLSGVDQGGCDSGGDHGGRSSGSGRGGRSFPPFLNILPKYGNCEISGAKIWSVEVWKAEYGKVGLGNDGCGKSIYGKLEYGKPICEIPE
ncbi:keratin, type II cytoskeletal 1-like [Impatiens glandulifera]|uniref:keratin, type II cytoskeletal 1-like n=1 Tax=Impatiens glandulifera TaxID=253017 RepID=UPI001FB07C2E|nr:keratin, type II cytoskeletal 1-like [Impatiens glandulifera]